jgi:hypothetical protein
MRTNRVETALGNFRSVRPKFVVRKRVRANVTFAVAEILCCNSGGSAFAQAEAFGLSSEGLARLNVTKNASNYSGVLLRPKRSAN